MTYQRTIGIKGERIAAAFLLGKGYQIIEKNFYSRYGEIDIVAQDSGVIVFVEVKTRTNQTFGDPEASITHAKIERIQKAGLTWLQAHPESPDDWRIEAISIFIDDKGNVQDLRHFTEI